MNRTSTFLGMLLLVLSLMLAAACSEETVTPVETVSPTPVETQAPVSTPTATAAPTPTATPAATPSPTPEPTPEPTPAPTYTPAPPDDPSRTAHSWYYMRQEPGEVPRFPHEMAQLTPEQQESVVWVGEGSKVYLTFDTGGPMGEWEKLLDILKDNEVQVTFFFWLDIMSERIPNLPEE